MGGSKEEGSEGSAEDREEPGPQNQGITSKRMLRRAVWWRSTNSQVWRWITGHMQQQEQNSLD